MEKVFKLFVFGFIAIAFSACEFMSEEVEPIDKTKNVDSPGGQGGGRDHS